MSIKNDMEDVNMCKGMEDLLKNSLKKGERKGKKEGKKEGMEIGRQRGERNMLSSIIRRMLSFKTPVSDIMAMTGADEDMIRSLAQQQRSFSGQRRKNFAQGYRAFPKYFRLVSQQRNHC